MSCLRAISSIAMSVFLVGGAVLPPVALAVPLDSLQNTVRNEYIPNQVQNRMSARQAEAQQLLQKSVLRSKPQFYGGATGGEIGDAIMKDLSVVTDDINEFLGCMEYSIIGLCIKIEYYPPNVRIGPYYAYYYPTTTYEVRSTWQSEYVPEAIFESFDNDSLSPEETLHKHVQGEDSTFSDLGLDASTAIMRAYVNTTKDEDKEAPENINVNVTRVDKAFRRHSGGDGMMTQREWTASSHILQMAYAEEGQSDYMKHKDEILRFPIIPTETPYLSDFTHLAEASNLLFPATMGLPVVLGGSPRLDYQWGFTANPASCMGTNMYHGNTPLLPFNQISAAVNKGDAFRQIIPTYQDVSHCTPNIGPDYPVTTFTDAPASRIPLQMAIRSNNLLQSYVGNLLAGDGHFDLKKFWKNGYRADKFQFRPTGSQAAGYGKDHRCRFLLDKLNNDLWDGTFQDKNSWVADADESPESFLSGNKHRPGIDADDPQRYVVYQWSGFRFCDDGYWPLLTFDITDDDKDPEIRGYEEWPYE